MSELVLEAIEAAHNEVVRLCGPGERWRMSIPANELRDSDLIIVRALTYARAYVQALEGVQEPRNRPLSHEQVRDDQPPVPDSGEAASEGAL